MKKKFHEQMENFIFGNFFPCKDINETKKLFVEELDYSFKRTKEKQLPDNLVGLKDYQIMSTIYSESYLSSYHYMLYSFIKNDGKVFEIDGKLAEALYNTDITFIPEEIHFPFNSFILYIDNSNIQQYGYNDDRILFKYNIQYIMVDVHEEDTYKIISYVIGFLDEGASEDNFEAWNNTTLFNVKVVNGVELKKTDLEHLYPEEKHLPDDVKALLSKSSEGIINFLFNFSLYVTDRKDDLVIMKPELIDYSKKKNKAKINQAIKQNEKESSYNIYYIGKKYSGIFKQSAELASRDDTSLLHRTLVRGHWRMQWYGHRTEESFGDYQKRIWIEPFYKGFEIEDQKQILYKIK